HGRHRARLASNRDGASAAGRGGAGIQRRGHAAPSAHARAGAGAGAGIAAGAAVNALLVAALMALVTLPNDFTPRWYQRPFMSYFDNGGRSAVWVIHRRGGKDLTAMHQTNKMAHRRRGEYWHI